MRSKSWLFVVPAVAVVVGLAPACGSSSGGTTVAPGTDAGCTDAGSSIATALGLDAGSAACQACVRGSCTTAVTACAKDCSCNASALAALACLEASRNAPAATAAACVSSISGSSDAALKQVGACLASCASACSGLLESGAPETGAPETGAPDASNEDGSSDAVAPPVDSGTPDSGTEMDSGAPDAEGDATEPQDASGDAPVEAAVDAGPPPVIDSFTVTVTGGAPTDTLVDPVTTGATSCTINGGAGPISLPCNGTFHVTPTATTTYTLSASNAGGTVTATATVYCGPVSNPTMANNACPSGFAVFCESVPIDVTSSSQCLDACATCNGSGCGNLASGFGQAYGVTTAQGTVYYVWQAGTGAAPSVCSSASYRFTPGDILANMTCPDGTW